MSDPLTLTIFIIETVILVGIIILNGVSIFKKNRGKTKLTTSELIDLQNDLCNYAKKVYETVSYWSDLNRDNFDGTDEEYRRFLICHIVNDFDELTTTDPDCPINKLSYDKLSEEDKNKIAAIIADKFPEITNIINPEDDNSSEDDEDVDSDATYDDGENESSTVDIGEYL